MDILDIDIETYSSVELKKANVYAYSESPDFEVVMCGWSLNGSPVEVYDSYAEFQDCLREIPGLWDPEVKKVAHNAGFERVCLSRYAGMPVGEYLPPEEWFDTAAVAALKGLPRSLESMAKTLKVTPKDSAGTRLINLFCKPYRGRRVMPHEKPEEWSAFRTYCGQDVSTMQEARKRLGGWPTDGFERDLWYVDQRINDRGIRVDLALASKAVEAAHANTAAATREVIEISGVENPGSGPQLHAWLESVGRPLSDLQATTVADVLSRSDLADDDPVRRVLELRQELALVAHRKFEAVLRGVSLDGRLRGQFKYHAAHTARWSSNGVQVHNLPRLAFEYKDEEGEKHYDDVAEDVAILALLRGLGASPETLKKCVRPMLIIDGTSSDFSAIEARVLAWLSGEDWVLRAFVEGRDLYVETAERMGGGMGRPEGKIAVLAAGYQGSVGSFRNMGYGGRRCPLDLPRPKGGKDPRTGDDYADAIADLTGVPEDMWDSEPVQAYLAKAARLRIPIDAVQTALHSHVAEKTRDPNHKCDVEIKAIVNAWRDANSMTRQFWYDLESKFWSGGTVGTGKIRVEVKGSTRLIHLPSGRVMTYRGVHKVRVKTVDEETGEVRVKQQLMYQHVQGYQEKTYGGRLTENVTQAVARDLLADALIRLDKAGYPIVMHVHDEADVESPDVEGVTAIMRIGPAWAEGLPLDASGDILYRYRKE